MYLQYRNALQCVIKIVDRVHRQYTYNYVLRSMYYVKHLDFYYEPNPFYQSPLHGATE